MYPRVDSKNGSKYVGFRKYKSIKKCKHCGNVVYSTKRDNKCNVANKKFRIYK